MTKSEIKTKNEIRAFIKSSKVNALRAWIFIFKCQTPSEHALHNTLYRNDVGMNNHFKEYPMFQSIVVHALRNQTNPSRRYLLTKSQWNIVQNTDKLAKYWRQINFLINSTEPEMEQLRIALAHHVDGLDDLPNFKMPTLVG